MRIFANRKFKRFVIILITVVMLFNVIAPQPIVPQAEAASVGGILMSPLTALAGGLAWAFQHVLNFVTDVATLATSGGTGTATSGGATGEGSDVFISDIAYNELSIINANIFDPSNPNPLLQSPTNENGGITGIVKQWYGITRMMAIAASLVILVYVAIKIIIASTGKDKAKYTELLKDWLLSLLLIFALHYVMAAILFMSDALVNFFLQIAKSGTAGEFTYNNIRDQTFAFNDFSIVYALVWIAMLVYTFVFLVLYIKRLILICFFVVISPLIVILSTINKLRGKGSGVLDYWLKQFIANVVMQPMDALLFTIIGSSIVICINSNQPLLALAFIVAFFPMRSWITQFFDQKADQNTQEGAAKFAANGANMLSKQLQEKSNSPKKPKFNTSNIAGAIAGSKLGGGSGGSSSGGGSTGGSSGSPRPGWRGGRSELSPEQYQAAMDSSMNGDSEVKSEPHSFAADTNIPLNSGADGENTSGGTGAINTSRSRARAIASKGGKMLGRTAKVGLTKGTGALMGATVGGLNMIAGKSFSDSFESYKKTSGATQKLMGGAIDKSAKKALEYKDSAKEGGISGIGEQFKSDISSVKDNVVESVQDSYIVSGREGIVDDKVAMGEFFADGEVDDLIHELIEEAGEGNPLYDQYMSTDSVGNKRAIAQQFFMESAIRDYGGADRFRDLMSRKKNNEAKAMLSVMQKHKGALTGKNASKKKEQVKQRNINYNNNN